MEIWHPISSRSAVFTRSESLVVEEKAALEGNADSCTIRGELLALSASGPEEPRPLTPATIRNWLTSRTDTLRALLVLFDIQVEELEIDVVHRVHCEITVYPVASNRSCGSIVSRTGHIEIHSTQVDGTISWNIEFLCSDHLPRNRV